MTKFDTLKWVVFSCQYLSPNVSELFFILLPVRIEEEEEAAMFSFQPEVGL